MKDKSTGTRKKRHKDREKWNKKWKGSGDKGGTMGTGKWAWLKEKASEEDKRTRDVNAQGKR